MERIWRPNRKNHMKKFLITFFILFASVIIGVNWFASKFQSSTPAQKITDKAPSLKIGNAVLNVDFALTVKEKERGLSGKKSMPKNQGMLFVNDKPDFYSFWMKDMMFPIDIIWIDENYKIVDIIQNVKPDSFPETFKPSAPAKFILEVNARWAEKNNITEGMDVFFEDGTNFLETSKQKIEIPKEEIVKINDFDVLSNVPFVAQAPLGNWKDERQENGCEEAAALMAMAWVNGKKVIPQEAEKEIIAISDYELETYGEFHDTSAKYTVERIFGGYFNYKNVEVKYGIGAKDIKQELKRGNLVIVPVNGQKVGNPFYNPPGPLRHNILIIGYDAVKKEFITNDSGTKRGASFRYGESVLEGALQDYPTGFHEPIEETVKSMIVVKKGF